MDLIRLASGLPDWAVRGAESVINNIDPLRRWVNRRIINGSSYAVPPRPRPLSMAGDYASWPGLTDRRFSGRHLPPPAEGAAPAHPDLDKVVALFERKALKRANDTSLLFPFFAQWFVDSFLRTKWEPGDAPTFRHNESNHEIDLCQIYGMGEAQARMLRDPDGGGRLRSRRIGDAEWPAPLFQTVDGLTMPLTDYRLAPEHADGLYTRMNFERVFGGWTDADKADAFAVGLEHGNSTLGNSVMNTLFLREHNRTAGILARAHPDWDDERLFQTARNITTVVLLNIVISDYIVHIAPFDIRLEAVPGMAEREHWYRTNWIAVEFALLYRWHDLIPDSFTIAGVTRPAEALRRGNRILLEAGLDQVLLDASRQSAGRIGLGNTATFLLPVKRSSIQMGRTCRLPSYNAYRRHYGLRPLRDFGELTGETEQAAALRALYGDIERLEWFVGLFAQTYGPRQIMGDLLMLMVANDAFTQALTNPLLARAVYNEATFGAEGLKIIESTRRLADVIVRNTAIADPSAVGFRYRPS